MSASSYKNRAALRRAWRAARRTLEPTANSLLSFAEYKKAIGWKPRVQRGRDPKRHPMMVGR